MGFSAEQLAKWVAERTDVHVRIIFDIFSCVSNSVSARLYTREQKMSHSLGTIPARHLVMGLTEYMKFTN